MVSQTLISFFFSPQRQRRMRRLTERAVTNDTSAQDDEQDEFVSATLESLTNRGKWPVKYQKVKKFHNSEDLNRVRQHTSRRYSHTPILIERTGKNTEGRLPCVMCGDNKTRRNTNMSCGVCSVPLCVNPFCEGAPSCYQLWHQSNDLLVDHESQKQRLASFREQSRETGRCITILHFTWI